MDEVAVTLKGEAGALRGTLINPGLRAPLVVVLRGSAFSRPSPEDPGYLGFSQELGAARFAVLFVSPRGTDDSPGFFSMQGWQDDAHVIMQHAFTLGFDQVALVGASAGAATALRYAALEGGVSAVASLASPGLIAQTTSREHGTEMVYLVRRASISDPDSSPEPDPDAFYDDMVDHDPLPVIDKISPTPLLLIQGDADTYVSVATAQRLFDGAGEPKDLLILPGAGHVLRKDPRAVDALVHWLRQHLTAT